MVRHSPSQPRRTGIILVIVVSMLALFAVVGLGYMVYSEGLATAAADARRSQVFVDDRAEHEPEVILNRVLGQIIYGLPDDASGVYSSLRGHSLARSMYGWLDPATTAGVNANVVPFNGTGPYKFKEGNITGSPPNQTQNVSVTDSGLSKSLSLLSSEQIVNLMLYRDDPFIRDPERYPVDPANPNNYKKRSFLGSVMNSQQQRWYGGRNVPYTYPDLNNFFLGAVRASDGVVLMPSFHRPWLFPAPGGGPDYTFLANQTHPDWYTSDGRLKLMRVRPVDQLTPAEVQAAGVQYPIPNNLTAQQINQLRNTVNQLQAQGKLLPWPTDIGGDVKNLLGSPGGSDSVWMDLGLPVRRTRSGKAYKPLVAMLIRDVDGLINLNMAGNLRGGPTVPANNTNRFHVSNQGLGRSEINLEKILGTEAKNIFLGNTSAGLTGRFATGTSPTWTSAALASPSFLNPPTTPTGVNQASTPFFNPPYYAVDVDGARIDTSTGTPIFLRSLAPNIATYQVNVAFPLALSSYPDLYTSNNYSGPATAVSIGGYDNDDMSFERTGNPMLFNPLRKTGNSRLLDGIEMHRIHARYSSPVDWSDSTLGQLLPTSMSTASTRHMVTLFSADLSRPGLTAQSYRFDDAPPVAGYTGYYMDTMTNPNQTMPWASQGELFPDLRQNPSPQGTQVPSASQTTRNDFLGNPLLQFANVANGSRPAGSKAAVGGSPLYMYDGRNLVAGLRERIDLNRPLRSYPPFAPGNQGQYIDTNAATYAQNLSPDGVTLLADVDRQQFAREIFDALCQAVGAPAVTATLMPTSPEFATLKYLAQLAVNIVDDIDEDDVMTIFKWVTTPGIQPQDAIVVGVEHSKVLINEVYVEQNNGLQGDPKYTMQMPNPPGPPKTVAGPNYRINVFAELHHTMTPPTVNDPTNPTSPASQNYQGFINRHAQWLANGPGLSYSAYRMYLIKSGVLVDGKVQPGQMFSGIGDPTNPQPGNDPVKYVQFSSTEPVLLPVDTASTGNAGTDPCSYKCKNGVKNAGFYVVGPEGIDNLQDPAWKATSTAPTIKSDAMWFDVPVAQIPDGTQPPTTVAPTVVLQRLANPYLQPSPNNPYVAIDVMDFNSAVVPLNQPVGQALKYNMAGDVPPGGGGQKATVVRRQPFSGNAARLVKYSPSAGPGMGMDPDNTFFSHNAKSGSMMPPMQLPEQGNDGLERFDWYVHHDRKLTSPVELIHVAGVPPWQVTQTFMYKQGQTDVRQGHTAAWLDECDVLDMATGIPKGQKVSLQQIATGMPLPPGTQATYSTRLYRALEMFRVGDRTVEMAFGGRDLGKVNINTVWDKPIFDAVCDAAQVGSFNATAGFTQADVDSAWAMLTTNLNLTARTSNLNTVQTMPGPFTAYTSVPVTTATSGNPYPYTQITGQDLPFWGMGAPHETASLQYPPVTNPTVAGWQFVNQGIEASLFRSIQLKTPGTGAATDPSPRRGRIFDAESQFYTSGLNTPPNPDPAVRHPLMEKALLAKIFEHLTVRSNVFEVYMTVGYFEVRDDSQQPELLGDEVGILRDASGVVVENKAVRHRMFAIVDRTNLTLQPEVFDATAKTFTGSDQLKQGPAPFYYSSQAYAIADPNLGMPAQVANAFPGHWVVVVPATTFAPAGAGGLSSYVSGNYNGISWVLNAGSSVLYVNTGQDQQRMVVRAIRRLGGGSTPLAAMLVIAPPSVNPPQTPVWPTATSQLPAPPGKPILITNAISGNPGPQPNFDHKLPNYRGVVVYSVIMD